VVREIRMLRLTRRELETDHEAPRQFSTLPAGGAPRFKHFISEVIHNKLDNLYLVRYIAKCVIRTPKFKTVRYVVCQAERLFDKNKGFGSA